MCAATAVICLSSAGSAGRGLTAERSDLSWGAARPVTLWVLRAGHAHPVSPYGTHVELVGGGHVVVATRERPKLFFNESGHATHLFNGVCGAPNCPGEAACVNCKTHAWDYTLVAPLDV